MSSSEQHNCLGYDSGSRLRNVRKILGGLDAICLFDYFSAELGDGLSSFSLSHCIEILKVLICDWYIHSISMVSGIMA